jgi:ankyrin repeat protein
MATKPSKRAGKLTPKRLAVRLRGAVRRRDLDGVRALLADGADPIDWWDPEGQHLPQSALSIACERGDPAIVQELLAHGAQPTRWLEEPAFPPAEPLSRTTQPAIVRAMLAAGAPATAFALHRAVEGGRSETVKLLLGAGAPLDQPNDDGDFPLDVAIRRGKRAVIKLLLDHGAIAKNPGLVASLPAQLRQAAPPVGELDAWNAVLAGDVARVRHLLDHGHDADEKLLFHAMKTGQQEVACLLLDRGARLASGRDAALVYAGRFGLERVFDKLVADGVDPARARDEDGSTVLHMAAWAGHLSLVRRLVEEMGLPVDLGGSRRETALHDAASSARLDVIHYLVEKGADVEARDQYRNSPLRMARDSEAAMRALLDAGARAEFDSFRARGWTGRPPGPKP